MARKNNHGYILERALLKAHKNGWKPLHNRDWSNVAIEQWQGDHMKGIALLYSERQGAVGVQWVRELEGIIFNHDFAKALWGEEEIEWWEGNFRSIQRDDIVIGVPAWQLHLQRMVVVEDPIKYLGENL